MRAIILAGGFGTRISAVLNGVCKPMAPIQSRPFLALLLDNLERQGFEDVVLSVGYLSQSIMDYFGERYRSLRIQYSVEDHPLGTGGALRKALALAGSEPVFVLNGDTFVMLDYGRMLAEHCRASSRLSIALKPVADVGRYGQVLMSSGRDVDFREKGGSGPGWINAGVYVVAPSLFDDFELPESFSFEKNFLFPFVARLDPLAFATELYFIDIGVPEDYARAQTELPALLLSDG